MSNGFSLKQTNKGFEFENETVLEDFVWHNLDQLLGLAPLQRQYHVQGQYCDILGVGKNDSLAIIELKNSEDRYLIQKLTRYYDARLEEKPFSKKVNYKKSVSLIAIAPYFHKDNLRDIKYNTITFVFYVSKPKINKNYRVD